MKHLASAGLLSLLSACSQHDISQYQDNTPQIIVHEFFQGQLRAHGMVKNRGGELIRYFSADITGTCSELTCTLDEYFFFDDGEKQYRQWQLKRDSNTENTWRATANDVIGEHSLYSAGNALSMRYTLRLQLDDSEVDIEVDDRMYLIHPKRLINESTFTKFGFEVGSVSLMIEKLE